MVPKNVPAQTVFRPDNPVYVRRPEGGTGPSIIKHFKLQALREILRKSGLAKKSAKKNNRVGYRMEKAINQSVKDQK